MCIIVNPIHINTVNIALNSSLNLPAKLQGKTSAHSLITPRQSGAFVMSPRDVTGERWSFQNGQVTGRHLSEHSCHPLGTLGEARRILEPPRSCPACASQLAKWDRALCKSCPDPVVPTAPTPSSLHVLIWFECTPTAGPIYICVCHRPHVALTDDPVYVRVCAK